MAIVAEVRTWVHSKIEDPPPASQMEIGPVHLEHTTRKQNALLAKYHRDSFLGSEWKDAGPKKGTICFGAAESTSRTMRSIGFKAEDLRMAGYTADECRAAGFEVKHGGDVDQKEMAQNALHELRLAQYDAQDCKLAGVSPKQLYNAKFDAFPKELEGKEEWPSAASLKGKAWPPSRCKMAGFVAIP